MKLHQEIPLLVVAPLIIVMPAIMLTVQYRSIALARHGRQLAELAYLQAKEAKLRSCIKLIQNAIASLLTPNRSGDPTQNKATHDEAMRTLAHLNSGTDGCFFLYDLRGRSPMHPRQPELVGCDLWDLTDSDGRPTIQKLVAATRAGGGFAHYM